ncbi:hypothetical protein [Luteococcus peritonei]|uniref:Uncharacterized protein n=1 Tax=Luteococcus peritonei TaxID=88874 RepID=A0ABW4RWK5_9ACTN
MNTSTQHDSLTDASGLVGAPATPRRSPLARLGVGALALLAVGGLGYGAMTAQQDQTTPGAAPAHIAPARTEVTAVRSIPQGRFLVESVREVQKADQGAITGAPNGSHQTRDVTRTTAIDSSKRMTIRFDGKGFDGSDVSGNARPAPAAPGRDYAAAPTDPAALRAWLLASRQKGNERGDADVVFTAATDAMRDPFTSTQFRQLLAASLREDPQTTTSQVTLAGRAAVRLSNTVTCAADGAHPASVEVRTMTLDASSMAVLGETSTVRTADGQLVSEYHATATRPLTLAATAQG